MGILSQATRGDLGRSARFVKVLAPHGYAEGDELRAVFLDGESVWGCVALHRRRGRFQDHEANLVADVGGYIGQGIRRAILATALAAAGSWWHNCSSSTTHRDSRPAPMSARTAGSRTVSSTDGAVGSFVRVSGWSL